MTERTCGSCYACCVYLGITELGKRAGQSCHHLDGARGPDHRCSIYDTRPQACSTYLCGWRLGWFLDDCRPNQCGVLVTIYAPTEEIPTISATIWVIDSAKAGTVQHGPLNAILNDLICANTVPYIVVANQKTKDMIEFKNGAIRQGKLVPSSGLEDLHYRISEDLPTGTYHIADKNTLEKIDFKPI